jgi:hypothetical protein
MEVTALFFIGLLGSLHCIGMCGPIVLAIPSADKNDTLKKIFYNLGRIVTYSLMGLGAGFIGSRFFASGFQQYASIIFGASIIIYVIIPSSVKAKIGSSKTVSFIYNPVKNGIVKLFKNRSISSYLFIGILNGFLPCGFVYMALASSVVIGTPVKGMFAMALFGLGTTPALFFFSYISKYINLALRNRIKKFIPALVIILGIIFILRGMNLGIKYISPKII